MTKLASTSHGIAVLLISLSVACSGKGCGSSKPAGNADAGARAPGATAASGSAGSGGVSLVGGEAVPLDTKLELPPTNVASPTAESLTASIKTAQGSIQATDYDADAQAKALGADVKAVFKFVRDHIHYEAYSGVLRGADGTLAARAGNGFDRSLLLARMLGANGVQTRFAAGDLPGDRAEALYRHIFDAFDGPPAPIGGAGATNGFIARVARRARRDVAVIRAAVGSRLAGGAAQAREQAIRDIRRHVWVQASVNGAWMDLDSAFGDAEPGIAYCAARQTVEQMPDDWYQRVAVRVTAERVEDGALSVAPVLAMTMRAFDLVGESVFLAHVPVRAGGGMGLGAGSAGSSRDSWTPALIVGRTMTGGRPVDFNDDGGSGMLDGLGGGGSSSAFVAEWLELEVMRPDGRTDVTRRALVDRAGAAWRSSAAHEVSQLKPLDRNDNGPLGPQAIHNLLFAAGPQDLAAFADAIAWVAEYGEPSADTPVDGALYPFAVRSFAALVLTDHVIIPAVNNVPGVRLYSDSPRVMIVSAVPVRDAGVSEVYDLRRDVLCGLARDAQSEPQVAEQKLWFAALEGALEHEAVARDLSIFGDDPSRVVSTSSLLNPAGVELLAAGDVGRLGTLTRDAEKAARLRLSLEHGRIVVVPRPALETGPLGFWELAPNGDARAVLGEDLNSSRSLPGQGTPGLPRPAPPSGKRYSQPRAPGAKRGKIELVSQSRAGDEYLMVLEISQAVVVGVTALGVVLYKVSYKQAEEELAAWKAAEQAKQDKAMRAARGGR